MLVDDAVGARHGIPHGDGFIGPAFAVSGVGVKPFCVICGGNFSNRPAGRTNGTAPSMMAALRL